MKTVIVFASKHHGNTKKLVDAIAAVGGADVIDATATDVADLGEYDLIGFASGIAFGKYYPQLLQFMEHNLPGGKKVFFLHTAGSPREKYHTEARALSDAVGCESLGTYCCKGFDTYGPFKWIGGIAKGHPNQKEIDGAVSFFKRILTSAQNGDNGEDTEKQS